MSWWEKAALAGAAILFATSVYAIGYQLWQMILARIEYRFRAWDAE